jgi:hypothetical protein
MPVNDQLDDYEIEAVDGDPFASSPDDYEVEAVDYDPFAAAPARLSHGPGQALPDDLRRRLALISQPR